MDDIQKTALEAITNDLITLGYADQIEELEKGAGLNLKAAPKWAGDKLLKMYKGISGSGVGRKTSKAYHGKTITKLRHIITGKNIGVTRTPGRVTTYGADGAIKTKGKLTARPGWVGRAAATAGVDAALLGGAGYGGYQAFKRKK